MFRRDLCLQLQDRKLFYLYPKIHGFMSQKFVTHIFIGLPVFLFQTVYMQEIFILAVYNSALHCKVCVYTKKNKNNIKSYYLKEGILMDFRHDIQQCLPSKLKTMLLSEEHEMY